MCALINLKQPNKALKIPLLLFVFCFFVTGLYGQNEKKNLVGIHTAFGSGLCGVPSAGAADYDVKYYFSMGLDYSKKLSKRWDFWSGLEYTYSHMVVTPQFNDESFSDIENLTLVTIPAQFKYHFGKVVYIHGGMLINVLARSSAETWVQSQNGTYKPTHNVGMLLGCGLGVGFEHEFSSGLLIYLNPYVRWNGFGGLVKIQTAHDLLFLQGGVSLGVGYKF